MCSLRADRLGHNHPRVERQRAGRRPTVTASTARRRGSSWRAPGATHAWARDRVRGETAPSLHLGRPVADAAKGRRKIWWRKGRIRTQPGARPYRRHYAPGPRHVVHYRLQDLAASTRPLPRTRATVGGIIVSPFRPTSSTTWRCRLPGSSGRSDAPRPLGGRSSSWTTCRAGFRLHLGARASMSPAASDLACYSKALGTATRSPPASAGALPRPRRGSLHRFVLDPARWRWRRRSPARGSSSRAARSHT